MSYLSGGLMYGREVEMPANFGLPAMRKREYRPRLVKPRTRQTQANHRKKELSPAAI